MRALLVVLGLVAGSLGSGLFENSGFHCKHKLSMKLSRKLHGSPQTIAPPLELQVLDEHGEETSYYEPGKIYTVRLIGYHYYRGLMLQARLSDENGFLIGSLRGGRFLETPAWLSAGLRMHECDPRFPQEDCVTHADDTPKYLSQVQWTTPRDIGNVQFILTVAIENEVYWEKWRPRSGMLHPVWKQPSKNKILSHVFVDEKLGLDYLAGKLHAGDARAHAALSVSFSDDEMPQIMGPETEDALIQAEIPEFWTPKNETVQKSLQPLDEDELLAVEGSGQDEASLLQFAEVEGSGLEDADDGLSKLVKQIDIAAV